MLRNYLKTTFRNLLRHKGYSLINVFGLTIGLAASIFILLWVIDELSYDHFHEKGARIYNVFANEIYSDGQIKTAKSTPMKLAEALIDDVPEIENTVRSSWPQRVLFKFNEKSLVERGHYADPSLFKVFTFPLLAGDSNNPLPDNNSVAISETMAKKYFGNANPIGEVFRVGQKLDLKVSSVFADAPDNSSLIFDFVIPYEVWRKARPWNENWRNSNDQIFACLKSGASLESANKKIKRTIKKNCKDCNKEAFLSPFTKSRLYDEFANGSNHGGRISYVISFSIVALIILVIACINFMNLTTARSTTRSREVGIRKVVGAQRTGLITQFLGESILLSFIALVLAIVVVQLLLPFFNEITDKHLALNFNNFIFTAILICIALFCGLTAGSYPAFFLSAFKPASVFKGISESSLSGKSLRQTLVVVQFVISIVFIVASIVVYKQIEFIHSLNLGFDKENIIVIDQQDGVYHNQTAFKNELLQYPEIRNVAFSGNHPFNVQSYTTDPTWPGKPDQSNIAFKVISCDNNFIPTLGMTISEGRNFGHVYKHDSANYIINEKSMEVMGLTKQNAIGTDLDMWMGKGKIIGVVKDFNNVNLHKDIEPLIFVYNTSNTWKIFMKIQGNPTNALRHIEAALKKYDPDYPLSYSFLDEDFDKEYRSETAMGKFSLSFTIIAISISCLGLFGLAAFTAERRIKELAVRKILGASMANLVFLLCSNFAKLVFIAVIIAIPIASYTANQYLGEYAFHVALSGWVFVLTSLIVLGIAMLTVGYQSIKAAVSNPVDSLSSE